MSLFNVGAGREPAEIGVAEYQKPDYQQFDKLADINEKIKQQQLKKEEQKTKDWGDILNTNYSTKYGVEQAKFVSNGIESIKQDMLKDVKKNPSLLNDNSYMLEVKGRLEQIGGYVKALDSQYDVITKDADAFEKDYNGKLYDRKYFTDYMKAMDDPIAFMQSNPDSEVSKNIAQISNNPNFANLDPNKKRIAVRGALQALPKKVGNLNIKKVVVGKPQEDISRTQADMSGHSSTYNEVSPVSALNYAMQTHKNGSEDNVTYRQSTKKEIINRVGEDNYNDYLNKLKQDYTNIYRGFETEYKDEKITKDILSAMPKPENLTEGDLLDFDWGLGESKTLVTKKATENQKITTNIRVGDGNKNATNSNTINTIFKLPIQGKFDGLNITTTTIDPIKSDEQVVFNNVFEITGAGYLNRIESGTTTGNLTAPMGQVQVGLVPVYIGRKDRNGFPVPLNSNEQKDMVLNPSAWKGKVIFKTGFMSNSVSTQKGSKKIDSSVAFASDNMKALNTIVNEAKNQKYKDFIPSKPDYSFEEGLQIYNQHGSIQAPNKF